MKIRILSVFLAFVMIFSLLPVNVFAETGESTDKTQPGDVTTDGGEMVTFTSKVTDIESISAVATKQLFEGLDGDRITERQGNEEVEYFRYYVYSDAFEYTITYNGGKTFTGMVNEVCDRFGDDEHLLDVLSDQSYDNQWGVGKHTVTVSFLGKTCEAEIEIVENPIDRIKIVKSPNKTTFLEGEYIDFQGAVLRVYYSDGSFEDIEFTDPTVAANIFLSYHSTYLNRNCELYISNYQISKAGIYAIELGYLNANCTYNVAIVKSDIVEIELQSPDQNTLILHATKSDGTAYDMRVLAMEAEIGGYILTDKGCLMARSYQLADGSFYVEVGLGSGGTMLKSNVLQTCGWMDFQEQIDRLIVSTYYGNYKYNDISRFDGTVTKENIDALVDTSLIYSGMINQAPQYEVYDVYPVYDGAAIQACVLRAFNLPSVDLSLSKNYDPLTGKYTGTGHGFNRPVYRLPVDCVEQNGMWIITAKLYYDEILQNLRLEIDESNRIHAFCFYGNDHTHDAEYPFTDVDTAGRHAPFADAIQWAANEGITTGYGDGIFAPDKNCSRAQVVTFLWRAAGEPEPKSAENPFVDVSAKQADGKDNPYYTAILWAVGEGITNGVDSTHFAPDSNVTRAQFVTFLWRYENKPAAKPGIALKDIDTVTNADFKAAILWAAGEEITTGYSDGTFRPNAACTRAHVVTFIYRDMT